MKDTQIDFNWIYNGKKYSKKLERNQLHVVFQGLVEGFEGDNEISKKMVEEIIPIVDTISINKDQNITQYIPFISYVVDGEIKILKIIRYHKIVWTILDKYCTE